MKYLSLLVVGILVIFGVYFFTRPNSSMISTNNDISLSPTPSQEVSNASAYQVYSKEAYEAAQGQTRVIFFHAAWCPTCKIANSEFESKKDEIPAGVIVYKTDYDSESELKAKYGITYQHTFVLVDANGNEIKKWNGGGITELINNTQ